VRIEGRLRAFLQRPHGRRISGEELEGIGPFIAVGDVVSHTALVRGVEPKLAVFDFYSERKPVPPSWKALLLSLSPITVVENPRGELREELVAMAPWLAERGGGLYVVGEEDALALAFLLTTPYPVLYGRRGEGMYLVTPSEVKAHPLPTELEELLKVLQGKHSYV